MWKIVATIIHVSSGSVTYYSPGDRFHFLDECKEQVKSYQGAKAESYAESFYHHPVKVTLACKLDGRRA